MDNQLQSLDQVKASDNLFNTILGHTDRSKVVIPNRKIAGEIRLQQAGPSRQRPDPRGEGGHLPG